MQFLKIVMLVLVGALAIAAIASPAVAQCGEGDLFQAVSEIDPQGYCDPDEEMGEEEEWNEPCAWLWWNGSNWIDCDTRGGSPPYPGYLDTAQIPPGKCIQPEGSNDVGILQVQKDENDRGRVVFIDQDTLSLHCDSVVDGDIIFLFVETQEACDDLPGHLYIAHTNGDSLQISGNTGKIFTVNMCGLIEGDEGMELDLHSSSTAEVTVSDENGREIAITVMTRNRATVTADGGRIELKGEEKYGNGIWRAENGGTLELLAGTEVSASGDWEIPDDGGDSSIIINHPCLNLSGKFDLRAGTLHLYEDICTTGRGYFHAENSNIDVLLEPGVTARFNSSCN